MNERIKEIHRQVMLWSDTPDCPDTVEWHPGQIPEEYTKKFAELLIRECAELSVNSRYANTKSEYYEGFNEALVYVGNKIKQHFGVEE